MTDAPLSPQSVAPDGETTDRWTVARDLYLSGQPGQAVCEALRIAPSTFWRRAATENWLRRDRPSDPAPLEPLDMSAPADEPEVAADKAWRRVCAAPDAGRSGDALRWLRVHAMMKGQDEAQRRAAARHDAERMTALSRTAREIEVQARAAARVFKAQRIGDGLEKVESTLTDSHPPRLSRAERRRLAKLQARARAP